MLESFRKYTGLMFVVLILLFVGLVFFGTGQQGLGSGPTVLKAHGRSFSQQEFQRMAVNPARLLFDLTRRQRALMAVYPYLARMGIFPGRELDADQFRNFLVNRVSLQKGMEEFGVYASQEEIEIALREQIFVADDGSFDAAAYQDFVEKRLPSLGMGLKEMNNLIGEVIAIRKLSQVLASGIESSPEIVETAILSESQRVSYQLFDFPFARFEADQNPSEEEVRSFWEERKPAFLSPAKRRISYVIAAPEPPSDADANPPADTETATPGTETATPDTETATPDTETATPADKETEQSEEERRNKAVLQLGKKMDQLWDALQAKEGEGFEELAAEHGFEVKTTGLVAKRDLPGELKAPLRGIEGATGADKVFSHNPGENKWDATSFPYPLGDEQWFLFRIEEAAEPRELPFKEARDAAHLNLVKIRAREAALEAAIKQREQLSEALEDDKSFEEAVRELDLQPTPFTNLTRPSGRPLREAEFNLAAVTGPNSLSSVKTQEVKQRGIARAYFLFVKDREVPAGPDLPFRVESRTRQESASLKQLAIDTWFEQQRILADVRQPSR